MEHTLFLHTWLKNKFLVYDKTEIAKAFISINVKLIMTKRYKNYNIMIKLKCESVAVDQYIIK